METARPRAAPRRLRSRDVREAEQLLTNLGYFTGPVDGVLDAVSRLALLTFEQVEGRERTGRLTLEELEALREASRPEPLEDSYAHIEVDISRQVLFVIDDCGDVARILPVSTGTGKYFDENGMSGWAYTPRGKQRVYKKLVGWHKSDLGLLYYPNYIAGGVAIHGSPSIPGYPASHGCIRIPLFASKEMSQLMPIGTVVIVHEGGSFVYDPPWQE